MSAQDAMNYGLVSKVFPTEHLVRGEGGGGKRERGEERERVREGKRHQRDEG